MSDTNYIKLTGVIGNVKEFNGKTMNVVTFGIGNTRVRGKDKEWFNIKAFGKLADDIIANQVQGGDTAEVEGQLCSEKWTGKDGRTRHDIYIRADAFNHLTKKNSSNFTPLNVENPEMSIDFE
ncbi:hypothetical protein DRO61_03750 [Candidatus Bathyarchaeota archaeon]|nr:MAG: hypothetical protein DRO61_03750 [Candidatus Bathyarchaeota archaeon]